LNFTPTSVSPLSLEANVCGTALELHKLYVVVAADAIKMLETPISINATTNNAGLAYRYRDILCTRESCLPFEADLLFLCEGTGFLAISYISRV
jgi:hypothetical protein